MGEERLVELEYAISKMDWDVIGLSEVRRKNTAIIERPDGSLFMHTSSEKGLNGVGFLLSRRMKENIIEFREVNDRIATLSLEIGKNKRLIIVQVYCPTGGAPEDDKLQF